MLPVSILEKGAVSVVFPRRQLRELSLFAGAGGGILGGILLGWRTICAVEINSYCREVLFARQRDGILPRFPIWDDIKTFDGKLWQGHIDVISGGFPCQDISAAGKGGGITGKSSSLVFEMLRIIKEVRPKFVFAENSPYLRTNGLSTIISELASLGYVGRVGVLGARHIGADHKRNRMWIAAFSSSAYSYGTRGLQSKGIEQKQRKRVSDSAAKFADTNSQVIRKQQRGRGGSSGESASVIRVTDWWDLSRFEGMDDGVADKLERVKATGNGQVPGVVALAWSVLSSGFPE